MRFDVITLFPEIFSGYLTQSLLKKALDDGRVNVQLHDLRRWSTDEKHHKVDDRPFGGGPGMVLMVEPVVNCVEEVSRAAAEPPEIILLTPQGERLSQPLVEQLAEKKRLLLLCGRYEGFDHRVIDLLRPREISVGDYILNGGEVAAMTLIDSVIRLVPGVLGDDQSAVHDSFSSGNRLLEFPQYTRPREFRGLAVPEVLTSGDHEAVARWRQEQSYLRTRRLRADLLAAPPEDQTHEHENPRQRGKDEPQGKGG